VYVNAWDSVVHYSVNNRDRVQAMLEEKSKGQNITVTAPEAPARAQIIDLMQALKQSLEKAKPQQRAAPAQRKRKAASSDS
jgi:non-homologous end joining protein Ku